MPLLVFGAALVQPYRFLEFALNYGNECHDSAYRYRKKYW